MDVQLTVRMSAEMKQAVDRAAHKLRRRPSEVVRMALQAFLDVPTAPGRRPIERVRGLIGSLESGVSDLAERHREYILESLKHGK
jgi:hypothetical protein